MSAQQRVRTGMIDQIAERGFEVIALIREGSRSTLRCSNRGMSSVLGTTHRTLPDFYDLWKQIIVQAKVHPHQHP